VKNECASACSNDEAANCIDVCRAKCENPKKFDSSKKDMIEVKQLYTLTM
jgi:hypothetical protein